LKLPVFCPPPRSAQRGFSTEKSRKAKAKSSAARSEIDVSFDDCESEQSSQMNKSAYVLLPSALKSEGDEEELDPLM